MGHFSLDVCEPKDVAAVLRQAADQYMAESEDGCGEIWAAFAEVLRGAAFEADRLVEKGEGELYGM